MIETYLLNLFGSNSITVYLTGSHRSPPLKIITLHTLLSLSSSKAELLAVHGSILHPQVFSHCSSLPLQFPTPHRHLRSKTFGKLQPKIPPKFRSLLYFLVRKTPFPLSTDVTNSQNLFSLVKSRTTSLGSFHYLRFCFRHPDPSSKVRINLILDVFITL